MHPKLTATLLLLAGSPLAVAQQAPAAITEPTVKLEAFTVTGSNIKRIEVERTLPVTVLTPEQLDIRDAAQTSDLVTALPMVTGLPGNETANATQNARGDNASVSFRGLASGNTLILLNGRRLVPHPISQSERGIPALSVNINTLPNRGLRSVDVLRDGASSIYGSDAVAGVMNFRMNTAFQGTELSLSYGLTGVSDAAANPASLAIYRRLLRSGLPVTVYALTMADQLDWLIAHRITPEWQVPGLTMRAVKIFAGNSLSGHTALLYAPYADDPANYGAEPALQPGPLNALVGRVQAAGLQAAIHANGDREIDRVLDAYALARAAAPAEFAARRNRIEHASITNAGIISLEDSRKSFSTELADIQKSIFNAQADLAERKAIVSELAAFLNPKPVAATNPPASTNTVAATSQASATNEVAASPESIAEYRKISSLLDTLTKHEADLSVVFTPESPRLKAVVQQLADNRKRKQQLEEAHPGLLTVKVSEPKTAAADPATGSRLELFTEMAKVAALESKLKVLTNQFEIVRLRAMNLDANEGAITELQRKKELEEGRYKYFWANLEQAKINRDLGEGRVSNINVVETPTPPLRVGGKLLKAQAMALFGGFAAALALAFLIEFYLDRTLKRPIEIEVRLGLPLFLSIPWMGRNGQAHTLEPPVRIPLVPETVQCQLFFPLSANYNSL